jgi:hypothetical protein
MTRDDGDANAGFSSTTASTPTGKRLAGRFQVYVTPFNGDRAPNEADWIPITDDSIWEDKLQWSPDAGYSRRIQHSGRGAASWRGFGSRLSKP